MGEACMGSRGVRTFTVAFVAALVLAVLLAPATASAIVTAPDSYEPDETSATAGVIATDGVWQQRTIYPDGDVDWVKFEAKAGHHYAIETGPALLTPGYDFDTELYLYNAAGTELDDNDDMDHTGSIDTSPEYYSRIVYSPTTDGTLWVRAEYYEGSGEVSHYALRVVDTTPWWRLPWAWNAKRVSVNDAGGQFTGYSFQPHLDADGSKVVFLSTDLSMLSGQPGSSYRVFARDVEGGHTTVVSVGIGGAPTDGHSWDPSLSADGRYVVYSSYATNLVTVDTNGQSDVFRCDLASGETTMVSVNPAGSAANGWSGSPVVSADGRYVAFASGATDLIPGDGNVNSDVFVRDMVSGETTCVSVTPAGAVGNNWSGSPSISDDGKLVAFEGRATDLVAGDDAPLDVFVRNLTTGTTVRASAKADGPGGSRGSREAAISADGKYVAFLSGRALVAADVNGDLDIYKYEIATATVKRITDDTSIDYGGWEDDNVDLTLSGDGRYATCVLANDDATRGDDNGSADDLFLIDTTTGRLGFVSWSMTKDVQADNYSWDAVISDDGKKIAFASYAANMITGDTNLNADVFLVDTDATAPKAGSDAKPSYAGPATIKLTGDDGSGSGLANIFYSLDGSAETTYTGPIVVTRAGAHTLRFRAVDNLGNSSDLVTVGFTVTQGGLTRPWSRYSVRRGASFEVWGWITPRHAATKRGLVAIKAYRLERGKWVLKKTFTAATMNRSYWRLSTKYAQRIRLTLKGSYKIVATHPNGDGTTSVSLPRFMFVR